MPFVPIGRKASSEAACTFTDQNDLMCYCRNPGIAFSFFLINAR
jgi:hypothetical protein